MAIFKPIAIADIEILVAMMRDFYAIDNYPIKPEISKKLFQEFISNENLGKAWLILSQNKVVGYVILTFVFSFEYQGKIAFLDELYLSKDARGKGIGKETVRFIQSESSKMGLKLIYLEVESHNEIAEKLYLASGFENHNRNLLKYKTY
jgi:ribosomal protein S18 acetylase RimI-like enzyme